MPEQDNDKCVICGEPATWHFGGQPLCQNVVCEQALMEEVNVALQLAAEVGLNVQPTI